MKKKKREKRKRGNSCLQWLVMGWKAGSGSECFLSLEKVHSLVFCSSLSEKRAPNVAERAGAAPLAFAVGGWGQQGGWQWPWCQLSVPCSVCIEGISVLAPQSKALLPYRLWTDPSSLDCHRLAAQKNPWANFAKRGHSFCVKPAWCSHLWGRALRVALEHK